MGLPQKLGLLAQSVQQDTSLNIGIGGAANASFKLQVTGTTNLTGALTGGAVATFTAAANPLILKSTAATTMYTEYYYNTSTLSGYIGNGSGILTGANNSDFIVRSEADLVLATGNNRRMTIASSTGAATFSSSVSSTQLIVSTASDANAITAGVFSGTNNPRLFIKANDSNNTVSIASASSTGSDNLAIGVGGGTNLYIKAGGNVGIGTSSPNNALLDVAAGGYESTQTVAINIGANIGVTGTRSTNTRKIGNITGQHYNNTDRISLLRYDSNVSDTSLKIGGTDELKGATTIEFATASSTTATPTVKMTITSGGEVQASGNLRVNTGGKIIFESGGTANSLFRDPANGNTVLSTAVDTLFVTSTGAERMRITSGGNVLMNTTSGSSILNVVGNAGAYTCSLQGSTTSGQSYGLIINGGSTSGDYALFVRNAAQGSPYIYVRGDGYLYSASAWSGSDRRLKENITDLDNGLNKVLGLKARKFDFIDGFKNQYGFIAQELQEIIPDAVSVFDEKEEMLAVKMDFIIPHLVKAVQEQTQIIKDLESRIKQLENK